jgi:hypothetical protein
MPTDSYGFRFFRAGGVDQVVLDEGALAHLSQLDEKLWLALACPTRGLELDPRTLDFIDTDKDGRIRPPEVLAAIAWAEEVFDDLSDLFVSLDDEGLPLAAFHKENPGGKALRDQAHRILKNLGRPEASAIKLSDVLDTEKIFVQTKLNGDGVVPVTATDDEALKETITEILKVMGPVTDRSGEVGVDQAKTDAFFDQVATYSAWLATADATVNVLGDATPAAASAMSAVRSKVDDYFMRARLAAYGSELGPRLDVPLDEATALAGKQLSSDDGDVARWPLAHIAAGAALPLGGGVNPAWGDKMEAFSRLAVTPVLGARTALTEADWKALSERFAAYDKWAAAEPKLPLAELGAARIRALSLGDQKEQLTKLIADDKALEGENSGIESVEKAIRFRNDLVTLVRNFVNFADFYGKRKAIFQTGTLFIDGRSCDLCLPVHDVAKHASLAGLAKAYLVYCDCTRKGAEKRVIVAAVTGGDVDNILVGRNGVFYDTKGDDWDATITRIIENPISVRQAFFSPYKRFLRMLEEQVAKRAAAADDKAKKGLDDHATHIASTGVDGEKAAPIAPPKADAPPTEPKRLDIGTIAAIGVAVGGIATFASSVFATFLGLGMWMPFGLVALLLAISGPSMVIAWLKLSQRNIGPILDANGWAVNAFARINIPFGGALTQTATLPPGAQRLLDDPFAEKRTPYRRYVTIVVVLLLALLWVSGRGDELLPEGARFHTFVHHEVLPRGGTPRVAPAPATSH